MPLSRLSQQAGTAQPVSLEPAAEAAQLDWAHLPAVAVQAVGRHCCPASRARLRLTCQPWHDAFTPEFTQLFIGPGSPCWEAALPARSSSESASAGSAASSAQPGALGAAIQRAFPALTALHLTASSSRDYSAEYTQELAQLLALQPGLRHLSLSELHELEAFDTLDSASLWDVLHAALPQLAGRLDSLSVSCCFWNSQELFGGLAALTGLTALRLANTPLETAAEVRLVAGLSQLVVLEFGIIFDGASRHADVPRALESIGDLQRLRALSIPMWRRSLGGRAHPLAPALSCALGRLTALTSLAVDGKFGHLCVVSSLTNLRCLSSAAPLSREGWQAISQLPQLTLLTSLTPAAQPLLLNSSRPHPGCDLGLLVTKHCLQGLDVAVLQPEHLATLGQFTTLQRLNLRCGSTFTQPSQAAQLLTALSCLPGSLTSLVLGPLLPLSAALLASVARSCPGLRELQARFLRVDAQQQAPLLLPPPAPPLAGGTGSGASGAGAVDSMQLDGEEPSPLPSLVEPWEDEAAAQPGSVSEALSRLSCLRRLELVLLPEDSECATPEAMTRRSSSFGGGMVSTPRSDSGSWAAAAAAASAVPEPGGGSAGGAARPLAWVPLQLGHLPRGLQSLVLSGCWQLSLPAGGQQAETCASCHGKVRASADDASGAAALCECMKGLHVLQLSSSARNASAGQLAAPQPLAPVAHSIRPPAAAALAAAAAWSSGSRSGSPARGAVAGLKRPASYSAVEGSAAAASSSTAGSASASSQQAVQQQQQQQQQQLFGDVFLAEASGSEKRSRSFSAAPPAPAPGQQQPGRAPARQQQQWLPAVSELCLFKCQLSFQALAELVGATGEQLTKLQLLQLQVLDDAPGSGSNGGAGQPRQSLAGVAAGSAAGSLSAAQLAALPVAWQQLQEWHLQPHQLWGLLEAGRLRELPGAAAGPGGAWAAAAQQPLQPPAAQQALPTQPGGAAGQRTLAPGLQHVSQLLNLRRLHVADAPTAFSAALPPPATRPAWQPRSAAPPTPLPLHDAHALGALLLELQGGLVQLPALRQLLLYTGAVTRQQPALPNADSDVMWTEAGEQLLAALPACRVRMFGPTLCEPPLPPAAVAMAGSSSGLPPLAAGGMLGSPQAGAQLAPGGAFGAPAAAGGQAGAAPLGAAADAPAAADASSQGGEAWDPPEYEI